MKYCTHCGKALMDEAVICVGCGCMAGNTSPVVQVSTNSLLTKLSERVKINGIVWIVANYESLTQPIITLVYNLVIGGVIGVAGSIYYFIAIRSFVMENKQAFLEIEGSAA